MAAEPGESLKTVEVSPQTVEVGLVNSNQTPAVSSLSELIKWSATSQLAQGKNSEHLAPQTAQPADVEVTVMTSEKQRGGRSRTAVSKKPGRKPRKATSPVKNTLHTEPVFDELVCSACGQYLNWNNERVMIHGRHYLLTCEPCYERIWERNWNPDVDGYQSFCCLCGEGGEVVLCDICDNVGCTSCITRVCGKRFCKNLVTDENRPWLCFSCNPEPLHHQMRVRRRLMDALRRGTEGENVREDEPMQ